MAECLIAAADVMAARPGFEALRLQAHGVDTAGRPLVLVTIGTVAAVAVHAQRLAVACSWPDLPASGAIAIPATDLMAATPPTGPLLVEDAGVDADGRPLAAVSIGPVAITVPARRLWSNALVAYAQHPALGRPGVVLDFAREFDASAAGGDGGR